MSVWYWAWNISMIDKKLSEKSKILYEKSIDIKKNYNKYNPKEIDIIHYYLNNGNFIVSSSKVPFLIKMAMYLMDSKWFLSIRKGLDEIGENDNSNIVEYISIYNITKIG